MKTELILVGKTANKHFAAGIDDYVGRIGHLHARTLRLRDIHPLVTETDKLWRHCLCRTMLQLPRKQREDKNSVGAHIFPGYAVQRMHAAAAEAGIAQPTIGATTI